MQVLRETLDVLRSARWPGDVVLQNSAVVVTVLALVVVLLLAVDGLSSRVLDWLR